MKKSIIFVALMAATGSANAALTNGSILNIGEGSGFRIAGPAFPFKPLLFLTGNEGLVLGSIQTPSGSHSGVPDGSENPTVDKPWVLEGNTGMQGSESALNVVSVSDNTALVDFSGWVIAWNGFDSASGSSTISMGSGFSDGVAQVTCGIDCGDGDTYTLWYSATAPAGSPGNFSGTQYILSLTGTVTAVPVPAALWLFGSGLLGLAGVARRRKVT